MNEGVQLGGAVEIGWAEVQRPRVHSKDSERRGYANALDVNEEAEEAEGPEHDVVAKE